MPSKLGTTKAGSGPQADPRATAGGGGFGIMPPMTQRNTATRAKRGKKSAKASAPMPVSPWIKRGHAYRGWGWVLATAVLWDLFAILLVVIGELHRDMTGGVVTRGALGYYATAAAALLVALCAFLRRRWAWQLCLVTSAPMLMFFPIGTVVAAMAMRALWRSRAFFEASRS